MRASTPPSARALATHIQTLLDSGHRALVGTERDGGDVAEVVEVLDDAQLLVRHPRRPETAIWCGPTRTIAAADVHVLTIGPGSHGRLAVTPFAPDAPAPLRPAA